jgi:uncharacterized membrane protein HdeD (DUF308 family)
MSSQEQKPTSQLVREQADQAGEMKKALRSLNGQTGGEPPEDRGLVSMLQKVTSYWWVELLVGVFWIVISVVVLKFNHASVTTVGILTGIMFLIFAAEEFLLAAIDRHHRWLWAIFGVLLTASGIVALVEPSSTFAGFADILGFVFLLIGTLWMVQAFAERSFNDLWWLTLISGILMIVLAFWVSGQFFLVRAYTLLIFAGIWAMTTGVIAIIRAFQIREVGQKLSRLPR